MLKEKLQQTSCLFIPKENAYKCARSQAFSVTIVIKCGNGLLNIRILAGISRSEGLSERRRAAWSAVGKPFVSAVGETLGLAVGEPLGWALQQPLGPDVEGLL